jgi:hypothetical protein
MGKHELSKQLHHLCNIESEELSNSLYIGGTILAVLLGGNIKFCR